MTDWFSVDNGNCPITTYSVYTGTQGSYVAYSGTAVTISSDSGKKLTISLADNIKEVFNIKASTGSLKEEYQQFELHICGNEVVELTLSAEPTFFYDKSNVTNTLKPVDVTTYFSAESTICPIESYIIEQMND